MYHPEEVEIMINDIPVYCKAIRNRRELNQRDLADLLNVRQATVSRWEKGLSSPDVRSFFRIINLMVDIAEEIRREKVKRNKLSAKKAKL
jgi:transcriptional regulator with XRE-family HTH domain